MVNKILSGPIVAQYRAVYIGQTYANIHTRECVVCAYGKVLLWQTLAKLTNSSMGKRKGARKVKYTRLFVTIA